MSLYKPAASKLSIISISSDVKKVQSQPHDFSVAPKPLIRKSVHSKSNKIVQDVIVTLSLVMCMGTASFAETMSTEDVVFEKLR